MGKTQQHLLTAGALDGDQLFAVLNVWRVAMRACSRYTAADTLSAAMDEVIEFWKELDSEDETR